LLRISFFSCFFTIGLSVCLTAQNSDQAYVISEIVISGNKVTKEKTILREIEISKGDTVLFGQLEGIVKSTQNNVMNMSLFNFVEVSYRIDSAQTEGFPNIILLIDCTERWYTWPVPFAYFEERNINEWLDRRDFSRFSWGMMLNRENFRGRREQIIAGFKTGFNDLVSVRYINPAIDKSQSIGLNVSLSYARTHNLIYQNHDNKHDLLKLDDSYAMYNRYAHLSITKRIGIHQSFRVYGQYNHYTFADTLYALNPVFTVPQYLDLQFFTISLLYKYDFRDYIHYPLEGFFFDCEANKTGQWLLNSEGYSTMQLKTSYRHYWKLKSRVFFAAGIYARLRLDSQESWYFTNSMGYGNDYVRGFEQYIIDGKNYYLFKSNIKYNIIKPRVLKLGFLKTEKFNKIPYRFYLNFFADAGYAKDIYDFNYNPLGNMLLFGYGFGVDFVTYYDRAYRVEISRNSKNEFSFAIQFTAPI